MRQEHVIFLHCRPVKNPKGFEMNPIASRAPKHQTTRNEEINLAHSGAFVQ